MSELTPLEQLRIRLEAQKEKAAKYEAAYENGAWGEGFDPDPGMMRYHVHGSGIYGRENPKVFFCEVCKWYAPLTHFMTSPECWQAEQKDLKERADKYGAHLWYLAEPHGENSYKLCEYKCYGCGKTFYWRGMWTLELHYCPECWAGWRKKRKREVERNWYRRRKFHIDQFVKENLKNEGIDIDPTCKHCGDKFTPKRSTAKYCSAKCRVAGNRAKTAKKKSAKKRRVRAKK